MWEKFHFLWHQTFFIRKKKNIKEEDISIWLFQTRFTRTKSLAWICAALIIPLRSDRTGQQSLTTLIIQERGYLKEKKNILLSINRSIGLLSNPLLPSISFSIKILKSFGKGYKDKISSCYLSMNLPLHVQLSYRILHTQK